MNHIFDPFCYDLHTHTNFSDGRSSVKDMVNAAQSNGLRGIAITDHVFNDEEGENLLEQYSHIDRTNNSIPVLLGCETAVADTSGKPCSNREILEKFDLVLMDFNGILFMQLANEQLSNEALRDTLCDVLIKACSNPEIKILAHPFNFGLNPLNLDLTIFDDERVSGIAKAFHNNQKIFEIMNQMFFWHSNVSYNHFYNQYIRILKIMKYHNVQFSLGSDAHSCCGVGCLNWSKKIVQELGLENQIFLPEKFLR